MTYCTHCGKELPEGVNFCPSCGAKVNSEATSFQQSYKRSDDLNKIVDPVITDEYNVSPKSKLVAALLACPFVFGLGLLGIHHFYLGNTSKGVKYLLCTLLLFWLIIPVFIIFILSLIDFINILSGEATDSEGKKVLKW